MLSLVQKRFTLKAVELTFICDVMFPQVLVMVFNFVVPSATALLGILTSVTYWESSGLTTNSQEATSPSFSMMIE